MKHQNLARVASRGDATFTRTAKGDRLPVPHETEKKTASSETSPESSSPAATRSRCQRSQERCTSSSVFENEISGAFPPHLAKGKPGERKRERAEVVPLRLWHNKWSFDCQFLGPPRLARRPTLRLLVSVGPSRLSRRRLPAGRVQSAWQRCLWRHFLPLLEPANVFCRCTGGRGGERVFESCPLPILITLFLRRSAGCVASGNFRLGN